MFICSLHAEQRTSIEKQLQSLSAGTEGVTADDAIAISNLEEQVKCVVEVSIQTCCITPSKLPQVSLCSYKPTGTFLALYSGCAMGDLGLFWL